MSQWLIIGVYAHSDGSSTATTHTPTQPTHTHAQLQSWNNLISDQSMTFNFIHVFVTHVTGPWVKYIPPFVSLAVTLLDQMSQNTLALYFGICA